MSKRWRGCSLARKAELKQRFRISRDTEAGTEQKLQRRSGRWEAKGNIAQLPARGGVTPATRPVFPPRTSPTTIFAFKNPGGPLETAPPPAVIQLNKVRGRCTASSRSEM